MIHRANSSSVRWGFLRLLLDRDRGADGLVVLVVHDFEVLELEVIDRLLVAVDHQRRVRERLVVELLPHLLDVVRVDVAIATSPDELADLQVRDLGDHVCQ